MKVVLANGMFRSGSTFFFDCMRKSEKNICFYEPFHPKLNELAQGDHADTLGHSVKTSPWTEHLQYCNNDLYYNYAGMIPGYIRQKMGYHNPLKPTGHIVDYLISLQSICGSQKKNVFACFNRAAFVLEEGLSLAGLSQACVVHTKRPSLQIAASFAQLYSISQSYSILERGFRDPWGISLLFHHLYTEISYEREIDWPSAHYSFLCKVCYVNTLINKSMQRVADYTLDISTGAREYTLEFHRLLRDLELGREESVIHYLSSAYKQDLKPARVARSLFDNAEQELLDSVGFSEYL